MRKVAKTLIVGTLIATPTCLMFAGTAASQNQVLNNQIQLGDVFATQIMDVVDVSDSTSIITPATGNTFTGSAVGSDANVVSTQSLQADVGALGVLNVTGRSGDVTVMSTAANGNNGESNIFDGATLTGSSTQIVGAVNVAAVGEYNGPAGRTGQLGNSVQAVANSQGYGVEGANAIVTVNQSSAAVTQADSAGAIQYTEGGTAVFSSLATSNNITATGTFGSAVTVTADQTMTGQRTQASTYASAGNAQEVTAQSTAVGNNISATNDTAYLAVYDTQDNQAYVRSEAVLSAYDFGAATANAYGVGNSTLAGINGSELILDNTQINTGDGVEVIAGFAGNAGYDAYVSATAVGNAVTGYACSTCSATMTVTNSQTNSTGVSAASTLTIGASNRSVSGLSSATGNTATFYVSQPQ